MYRYSLAMMVYWRLENWRILAVILDWKKSQERLLTTHGSNLCYYYAKSIIIANQSQMIPLEVTNKNKLIAF